MGDEVVGHLTGGHRAVSEVSLPRSDRDTVTAGEVADNFVTHTRVTHDHDKETQKWDSSLSFHWFPYTHLTQSHIRKKCAC